MHPVPGIRLAAAAGFSADILAEATEISQTARYLPHPRRDFPWRSLTLPSFSACMPRSRACSCWRVRSSSGTPARMAYLRKPPAARARHASRYTALADWQTGRLSGPRTLVLCGDPACCLFSAQRRSAGAAAGGCAGRWQRWCTAAGGCAEGAQGRSGGGHGGRCLGPSGARRGGRYNCVQRVQATQTPEEKKRNNSRAPNKIARSRLHRTRPPPGARADCQAAEGGARAVPAHVEPAATMLPLVKVGVLVLRQISKPIANTIVVRCVGRTARTPLRWGAGD